MVWGCQVAGSRFAEFEAYTELGLVSRRTQNCGLADYSSFANRA